MVKYSDLEIGVTQTYESTGRGISSRFAHNQGLLNAINVARRFTDLTEREIALDLYSSVENLIDPRNYCNTVCPNFGDERRVYTPKFDERHRKDERRGDIYVPVFQLHSHPKCLPIPSEQDLTTCVSSRKQELSENGYRVMFEGDIINVIHGTDLASRTHLLFYQFNGNEQEFERFRKSYVQLLDGIPERYKKEVIIEVADFLQKQGPFKTLHFARESSPSSDKDMVWEKPDCKKLAERVRKKFKFKFSLKRIQ